MAKTLLVNNIIYFLFLIFFHFPTSTFEALSTSTTSDDSYEGGTFEASLIQQACFNTIDEEACLSRLRTEYGREKRHRHGGPFSILHAAIKGTINEALRTIELISKFSTNSLSAANYNFREQTAIQDCVELLDLSVDELGWSVAETEKIQSFPTDVHLQRNLRAWLSAAFGNQDTCLEGFEGTDGRMKRHIEGSLTQVTQLVSNVLAIYNRMHSIVVPLGRHQHPNRPRINDTIHEEEEDFDSPTWMTAGERELVHQNPNKLMMRVDAVVALDGSGRYRSIMDAVNDAPDHSTTRYVIYVKKGVYRENVELKKKKINIMLVGDGMGYTVITGNRNVMQGWTTFRTATFAVSAMGFIARDITFRNTAGPQNNQAVALRVDSDCSVFFRCSVEGFQDTLYAHSLRQFYRDCNIYGTIDFIFGKGQIVIQHSRITARQPLPYQKVTITAQGRNSSEQHSGFSIHNCLVYTKYPTYLGRPWKQFSTTVFMQTYLSAQVQPQGWLEWNGDFALNTLYYGEYNNYGPGSSTSGRVKWPGYHILDKASANFFTVRRFIDGLMWLPSSGVSFTSGLFK